MTRTARPVSRKTRPLVAPGREQAAQPRSPRPLRAAPSASPAAVGKRPGRLGALKKVVPRRPHLPRSKTTLLAAIVSLTLILMVLVAATVVLRLEGNEPDTGTTAGRGLKAWQEAVEAVPGSSQARTGLGVALLAAGREGEAKRAFEKALKLNPAEWVAAVRLGELVAASDPDRAEKLFRQSAEFAPPGNKAEAYLGLGNLYVERDDVEKARGAFEDAAADNPYLVDARVGLAKALEALGDKDGALEQYREASQFDPSNPDLLEAIARLEGQP